MLHLGQLVDRSYNYLQNSNYFTQHLGVAKKHIKQERSNTGTK